MKTIAELIKDIRREATNIELALDIKYPEEIPVHNCFNSIFLIEIAIENTKNQLYLEYTQQDHTTKTKIKSRDELIADYLLTNKIKVIPIGERTLDLVTAIPKKEKTKKDRVNRPKREKITRIEFTL